MKSKTWNVAFVTVILILMYGCGGTNDGSGSDSVRGVSDDEVVFGAHTDLTGPIGLYGIDSVNGVRMRFDEVNETGGVHGRTLRFIVEDSVYDVTNSLRAADKLINLDKIFAMLLAMGTPNNLAVMQDQFSAGVPNLFPLTGSIQMAEPFHELMFTQRGIYYYEMRAALKHFVNEMGRETPCVSHMDNDFGHEIRRAVEDQAQEMGIEVAAITAHKTTETEFTASVLRLRDAGCDVVLMGTVATDTIGILSLVQEIGWEDVDFVGSNAGAASAIAELESGAGEGYYAFGHMVRVYPDEPKNDEALAWFNRYEERFNMTPDATAMEGYRGADLVIKALEISGRDLTVEKFIAALESIGTYTDIFGYTLEFSPENHNGVREVILSQALGGKWVEVGQRIRIN